MRFEYVLGLRLGLNILRKQSHCGHLLNEVDLKLLQCLQVGEARVRTMGYWARDLVSLPEVPGCALSLQRAYIDPINDSRIAVCGRS